MAIEVIMPKAGMDMQEGTVVKWFKKEGDYVKQGEILLEIITDKVNMEVEAEVSGTLLKINAQEGDILPVFSAIAYIGEAGEQNEKVRATPAARKKSKAHGLDLTKIQGSGPNGRIQKIDVTTHLNEMSKATPLAKKIAQMKNIDITSLKGSGFKGKVIKEDVLNSMDGGEQDMSRLIPLTPMRKAVARRMSDSFFTAPAFTLNIDVDVTNMKGLRDNLNNIIFNETKEKLTYTHVIVLACAKTLQKHPIINSTYTDDGILLHDHVSIALAVGLDEGLLVPVIRNAEKMSLKEIVTASKDLASRAANMKLKPEEQEGSTFTISNMGMYGIKHFNPIINQPNSAILGISTIIDTPVVIENEIRIRPIMNVCMTIDHRVIDGTPGAKFLKDLKDILENPIQIIL